MKLYLKQEVISWGDQFSVYDENQNEVYKAKGEVFTFGKKLHLYDLNGEEVVYIHQKVLSLLPKFYICEGEEDVAEVIRELTLFKPSYKVTGFDWKVNGDFTNHDFHITTAEGHGVASVSKKWLTWGDSYEIDIAEDKDVVNALAVVLTIDQVMEIEAAQTAAAASSTNN
ncbi:MAG: LURP-one-related family protein [Erysipelotrichaceae bacterium]|nr:LURP-one-related family protein [Erysipelotrichaceae bacterium]